MKFLIFIVKYVGCVLLSVTFAQGTVAAVTSCGSGNSLVYMEQKVVAIEGFNSIDVTNQTIPNDNAIFIDVKWSYESLSSHPASRWYVEQTIDTNSSNTGVRLSVDSFVMGTVKIGGYPLALSVGTHFVKTKLNFEDGRNCEINTPFRVESVDSIGQITSIDINGLVLGCGWQKGHDTGASMVNLYKSEVKFSVGGVNLGSTTANKNVPSTATSICPAGTGFSFSLTPKQLSDFSGGTLQASISHLNQDVVFDSKHVTSPVTGVLQHKGGLCLAPSAASIQAGDKATLVSCEGFFPPPTFVRLRPDGNLQVAGDYPGTGEENIRWCLHPEGGASNPGNGTKLVYWPSCGESRLQFELTAAGSLRHVSSGQCIHPEGGSPSPVIGTNLVFWGGCNEERLKFKFL